MASEASTTPGTLPQALIGAAVVALAGVLLVGAAGIPSEAGYGGVGSDFLPWLVGAVLLLCGVLLLWHAFSGGYRAMEEPSGAAHAYWPGFLWMTTALLANAALITTLGFVLSCALCYTLAVRGLRNADRPKGASAGFAPSQLGRDFIVGLAISAPVYWMFTKLLAINLPGLTASGWI